MVLNKLPSITAAFKNVVTATDAAIVANSDVDFIDIAKRVYFMHGHPKEIVNVLQQYTNSPTHKNKKYPLIALMRDIREELNEQQRGFGTEFKARLVICTLTKATLRADDREIKNFIPILYPVFEEFIYQLSQSVEFGMPTIKEMKIVKYDRYFWGSQVADKNVLNDCIDAIEIESISLKINQINCPTGLTILN